MAFTAVISLAAYQTVIAIAHNSTTLDFWGGILVSSAQVVLLVPLLSLPFIFGGIRSKRLRSEIPSTDKLLTVRSMPCLTSQAVFLCSQDLMTELQSRC